jgi:hypothetical protein
MEARPMMILTYEQRPEVERAGDDPVRVEDLISREHYVIHKAAVYDKLGQPIGIETCDPSLFEYGEFPVTKSTSIVNRN